MRAPVPSCPSCRDDRLVELLRTSDTVVYLCLSCDDEHVVPAPS